MFMNTHLGTYGVGLPSHGGSFVGSEDNYGVSFTSSQPAPFSQPQFNPFFQPSLEEQLFYAKQGQMMQEQSKPKYVSLGGSEGNMSRCSGNVCTRANSSEILPHAKPFAAVKSDAVFTTVTFHEASGDKNSHNVAMKLIKPVRQYVPGTPLEKIKRLICYSFDKIDNYIKLSDVIIVIGCDIPVVLEAVAKHNSCVSLVLLGDINEIRKQVKTIPPCVKSVLLVHSYKKGGNFLPSKEEVGELVGEVPHSIIGHGVDVIEFLTGEDSGNNLAQILCAMKLGGSTFKDNVRDILKVFAKSDDNVDPSPDPFE
jgi:hypothetical protein